MNATGFELILPFLRPIEKLILDPDISEIMVNGPERVFIERRGYLESSRRHDPQPEVARRRGKEHCPASWRRHLGRKTHSRFASTGWQPGSAVLPPCSLNGVILTIRKFNTKRLWIEDLIASGTLTRTLSLQLNQAVLDRQNILISGGTGTGKTTLLNALANFIPAEQRVLVIEDTAEIQIYSPNQIRFEARREQNGLPAVTIRDLLKASLRHRPDRILLGEIRGAEAFDLLQLLNTGHSGTISTVHANSSAPGHQPFHQLRTPKWRRAAVSRDQEQHRGLSKSAHSHRTQAWPALRFRDSQNLWLPFGN